MSVLNQMLRDLEKRGATHSLAAGGSAAAKAQAAMPSRRSGRLSLALVALLAGAAVLAGAHAWLDQRAAAAAPAHLPLGSRQYGPALAANAASVAPAPAFAAAPNAGLVVAAGAAIAPLPPAPLAPALLPPLPLATELPDRRVAAVAAATQAAAVAAESAAAPAAATSAAPPTVAAVPRPRAGRAPIAPHDASRSKAPLDDRAVDRSVDGAVGASVPAVATVGAAAANGAIQLTPTSQSLAIDPQRAEINRATDLIGRGRSTEAIGQLREVLARNPQHVLARRTLVALLAEAGAGDQAKTTLLDGAALDPVDFALAAAQMQAAAGDTQGALRTLEQVPVALRSASHQALTGGLAQRLGQHAAAVAAYRDALRQPDPNPVWWVGLAISLDALGQDEGAQAAYQQAAAQPGLPDAVRQFVALKTSGVHAPAAPAAVAAAAAPATH
jgi:MSHA biogenesis protein MshN